MNVAMIVMAVMTVMFVRESVPAGDTDGESEEK
jgi:hypothetical protein